MADRDDELDIDWDDPKAVAAARGDNFEASGEDDPDETPESDEETETESEEETETEEDEGKDDDEEDEEDESDEETETKAEDKDKDKGKGKKAEPMIPKSRYDSKAAENRTLKEQLAQYERQNQAKAQETKAQEQSQTLETEIDALEDQYMEAIGKDEMDKAKQLRKEIRAKEREMFQSEINAESGKTSERTREQIRLDMTIDTIEQNHPEFNPESDSYDEELVTKVQELRSGFEATNRYTPTQALLKAIDFVMPKREAVAKEEPAEDAATERRKAGLKKATEAARKQPPKTEKMGEDSTSRGRNKELDVDKLSYDDLAKLPEATLKRLRGDYAA